MNSNYITSYFEENFLKDQICSQEHFASVSYDGNPILLSLPEKKEEFFSIRKENLEFKISMKIHSEFDAVEWLLMVTNLSDEPSGIISDISVLDITIPVPADAEVIHKGINGDNCSKDSFAAFADPLICGETFFYKPRGGKSSHWAFPFFDICGQNDGLICGIGWSGTWSYEIKRTEKAIILKAGLPDARFYMKPQETLRLPRILLMGYQDGYRAGHNQFRKLMREYYSPKIRFSEAMKMPIALEGFDRFPEWNTEKGQIKQIDMAEKCGLCDTYWMDAVWFEGEFPKGVGNYTFCEGFPDGLTNISAHAHEKGIRVMIWFEPERVYYETEIEREHPEFLLKSKREDAEEEGRGRLINLTNPEAVDWLVDLIGGFIEKYKIDIYRQDFNIYPDSFWRENDEPDRVGITEMKYIEGEYRFLDALLDRFPNLMIDNCSSGGNRMDLESCIRCVFCWRSDLGCSRETETFKSSTWNQNQTLALSDYIVYHAISAWEPKAYDVRSAMTNGFAACFDVFSENFDFENGKTVLAECQRLRKYYEDDFYALSEADVKEDHWSICQFGTGESGVMLIFRREEALEAEQTIAFQALDTEKNYLLRIADDDYQMVEKVVSGKELGEGYTFCIKNTRGSLTAEYIRQ